MLGRQYVNSWGLEGDTFAVMPQSAPHTAKVIHIMPSGISLRGGMLLHSL